MDYFLEPEFIKSTGEKNTILINPYYSDIYYLDKTGICLLMDSSRDMSVSVLTMPEIF